MNKCKLIQSLIDMTENMRHRNKQDLDVLRTRASMIIKKIFGERSKYNAAMLNIPFYPRVLPADPKKYDIAWESGKQKMLTLLRTMMEDIKLSTEENNEKAQKGKIKVSNRIFVVHGHDKEMEEAVARVLEKLDLDPIILHAKPDKGGAIIEKIEYYSDVGYAIVLLSPDDYGYSKDQSPGEKKLRARQNVILELGFFWGRPGRENVLVIYREDKKFEFPSDYEGVIYKPYDSKGAWKYEIVKELKERAYNVSADKLS